MLKNQIKAILQNIHKIQQGEWINSKNHLIRIGKYGSIVRMNNPKIQSGPVAGKIYPTKPEEPICHAINDRERKEASLITHKRWIDNPPGTQDCHFLDIINDDIGPHGISINPQKQFDADAE